MTVSATTRLYLQDDHRFAAAATLVALHDSGLAFDQTCFYPGGGGQPPDTGTVRIGSLVLDIASVHADADGILWHVSPSAPAPDLVGQPARLILDWERRLALSRYHTVLHVLNTIALRDYGGWITGAQIAVDYSRIDFRLEDFSAALCAALEEKVNAVLRGNHVLKSYYVSEEEFHARDDLLRTLEVTPPVFGGQVRVVEIQGFDAQACGGTHVVNTSEVGTFSIVRRENKGRINKRLYVRLEAG